MSDIRDLLGKAIGDDEPPLGIDRDEVFRTGRQRVRRRRAFAAGGVVTAVVAAAVGAATLTNFVSVTPDPVPPAFGDSRHAPPGPDLPLPSTSAAEGPSLTTDHAGELTVALHDHVGRASVRAWPGDPDPPAFLVKGGTYVFRADVTRDQGEGVLQVFVGFAKPGVTASCFDVGSEYQECEVASQEGKQVAVATWKNVGGEKRATAVVIKPDGTKVTAMVSNYPRLHQDGGKPPTGRPPVMDAGELKALVVKPEFSVF